MSFSDLSRVFAGLVPEIQLGSTCHFSFIELIYRTLLLAGMVCNRCLNAWSRPQRIWICRIRATLGSVSCHILVCCKGRTWSLLLLLHLMLHADQFLCMERFLVCVNIAYDEVLFLFTNRLWQLLFVLIYKFLNIYACRQVLAVFSRPDSFFFNLNYLIILTVLTYPLRLLLIKMTFCLLLDVFWL